MTKTPQRTSLRRRLLIGVAILPCVYLLSIGPVAAIAQRVGGRTGWLADIYVPVRWLHHNTAAKAPLEWYARLWGYRWVDAAKAPNATQISTAPNGRA